MPIDLPGVLSEVDSGAEGLRLAWTDDYGFTERYTVEESHRVIAAARQAALGLHTLGATVEPISEQWEDHWPGIFGPPRHLWTRCHPRPRVRRERPRGCVGRRP